MESPDSAHEVRGYAEPTSLTPSGRATTPCAAGLNSGTFTP